MAIPGMQLKWLLQIGLAIGGMCLGIFLGWLAVRNSDWDQIREAFTHITPLGIFIVCVLLIISALIRALRWRLLWTEHKISVLRLFFVENAALGLNNISPIRAVDEALEFGILTLRDRLPGGTVVATMMMCRVLDLTFTLLCICIGVLLVPSLLQFTSALVFTALFLAIWLGVLLNFGRVLRVFPQLRNIAPVVSFEQAVTKLVQRKKRLIVVFGLTGVYWLFLAPVGEILASELGIDLPIYKIMVCVLGALFFATTVPGLPGAIGTFEFAVVSILSLWDVPQESALTFAIILHIVLFLPSTIIAAIVLPREGIKSLRALRELIGRWQKNRDIP
jgi:uncharacterized protein (TIRG00374 family)